MTRFTALVLSVALTAAFAVIAVAFLAVRHVEHKPLSQAQVDEYVACVQRNDDPVALRHCREMYR